MCDSLQNFLWAARGCHGYDMTRRIFFSFFKKKERRRFSLIKVALSVSGELCQVMSSASNAAADEPHHDHISPFHFSRGKDRGYKRITQGKCCIKWKTGWSRSVLYIHEGSLTRPSSYSIANNQTSKIQTSGSAVTKLVHILAKKMWTRYLATVERYEKTPKEDDQVSTGVVFYEK